MALAWFRENDYESFRRAVPDRHWHGTYAEWLKSAEQTAQHIEASGKIPIKTQIDSAGFVAWCRGTGRNVESKHVVEYATHLAILSLAEPGRD